MDYDFWQASQVKRKPVRPAAQGRGLMASSIKSR